MSNDVLTPLQEGKGPGERFVGLPGIWASLSAMMLFSMFLLYTLMVIWPRTSASLEDRPAAMDSARIAAIVRAAMDTTAASADSPAVAAPGSGAGTDSAARANRFLNAPPIAPGPGLDRNGYLYCAPNDSTSRYMPVATADTVRGADCIGWLWLEFPIWVEQRLFLIVILAGALGATVHALRSLAWYIGNRQLVYSWLTYYLALPLVGSLLATAFYLILRGGFFSPQTNVQDTSIFGFAAMSVIIGMFTTPAVLKLKEVAETVLKRPEPGSDTAPLQSGGGEGAAGAAGGPPVITQIERLRRASGNDRDALRITGSGFAAAATATVNGGVRQIEFKSAQELVLPLTEEDVKRIDAAGDFDIVVTNPSGAASKPFDFA